MPPKKIFLLLSSILFFTIAKPQSWAPVGNGLNYGGYVDALYVHDSILYAGGYFTSPGNNIAQWNGSVWDSLSSGINGEVFSFGYYQHKLYAGGWFSRAGGYSAGSIATWNGNTFANAGFDVEGGSVVAIQPYDSLLYIGGSFDTTNHTQLISRPLISWDGTRVDSVGSYKIEGLFNTNYGVVNSLLTYKGLLLIGNDYHIISWNNYKDTVRYSNYSAYSMATSNKNLYVGTDYDVYMYDSTLQNYSIAGTNGYVYALASYGKLLFAGGNFDTIGGIAANHVAFWNGKQWSALGNGLNGPVYSLAVFKNTLYAGGYFTSPGNGIAEYTIPPGLGIENLVNNYWVSVFPNPNNGQFMVVCNRAITAGNQPMLEVYNNLGQKVYSVNLTDGNNLIDMGKQAKGVYIYKITSSGNNLINPGKFVVE